MRCTKSQGHASHINILQDFITNLVLFLTQFSLNIWYFSYFAIKNNLLYEIYHAGICDQFCSKEWKNVFFKSGSWIIHCFTMIHLLAFSFWNLYFLIHNGKALKIHFTGLICRALSCEGFVQAVSTSVSLLYIYECQESKKISSKIPSKIGYLCSCK